LTHAEGPYGVFDWEYDGPGNRLTENHDGAFTQYEYYDMSDKLWWMWSPDEKLEFLYDGAGSMSEVLNYDTKELFRRLVYNDDSRLVEFKENETLERYYYDHLGGRVLKEIEGDGGTIFLYDLFGNMIGEVNSQTARAKRDWVYLGSHRIAQLEPLFRTPTPCGSIGIFGGESAILNILIIFVPGIIIILLAFRRGRITSAIMVIIMASIIIPGFEVETETSAIERVLFYQNDHLGTPKVMTNLASNVVWEAIMEPFGNIHEETTTLSNPNPFRFPGQYDDGTGLYYNWNRYYVPVLVRYNRIDPMNIYNNSCSFRYPSVKWDNYFYIYVNNNPLLFSDYSGLQCECPDLSNAASNIRYQYELHESMIIHPAIAYKGASITTDCYFGIPWTNNLPSNVDPDGSIPEDDCSCVVAHEYVHRTQ
jgi:RHS repeat-associated protein